MREQCLAYALDIGEEHGIWGGLTTGARAALHWRDQPPNSAPGRPSQGGPRAA